MQRLLIQAAGVAASAVFSAAAPAADPCDPATFSPAAHRFLEDCRSLAADPIDVPQRSGLQALRYWPIGDDAEKFVTLGGELRVRWERLDPQRFGLAGGKSFSAGEGRMDAHADVHVQQLRLFIQLNTSTEYGWPVPRPADHSAVDLAQGFVQLEGDGAANGDFVRFGRQEIALAPNRLIGVNEATNLRRTFDGVLAQVILLGTTTTAFSTRPVVNTPGAFDDRIDSTEKFSGVNLHVPTATAWGIQSWDGFMFRRARENAVFQNASGPEVRDTYGMRVAGGIAPITYLLQADWQRGHVGSQTISARAATLDLTWATEYVPWHPLFALSVGWAGGDRHPSDRSIGTFDTLYPNLSYGTDAGYFFPGNSRDASIAVTLRPIIDSTVQAGLFGYWRVSRSDAIYQPPGYVLFHGDGTGSDHVATLPFLKLTYRLDRYSELTASAIRLHAGTALTDVGGRSASYGLVQWQFRF